MANGKIRFGKQSGGQLALVIPDGVANTEVIVPESGILATEQYVNNKYSGFKNYIINGGFDIWQRGTSGISAGSPYTADMWKVWANGANTNWIRASSADFAPFSKNVGLGLKWWGDPASLASQIEHRIESINAYKLSGKKLTLSFLAKCSSNTTMNIELYSANSSDNFIGGTLVAQQGVSLKTTTQLFSITFDLTNTDVRNGCSLVFRPSVHSAIHWIAQVQLEEGSVATVFENRPVGLELSLCQRYFEVGSMYIIGNTILNGYVGGTISFNTEKRVIPTITPTNVFENSGNNVGFQINHSSRNAFRLYTSNTTNSTQVIMSANYYASAEL